jgi:L-seryl-tRNA(Ser) seleniumtransferase
MSQERMRALPSVGALLEREPVRALAKQVGAVVTKQAVRDVVAEARRAALAGGVPRFSDEDIRERALRLARGSLAPVLNGTGVVVHTNLGRAPLAPEALEAAARVGRGYATLEYDLDEGERGDRATHTRALLSLLTGAEDALVVNNNAAAVLLVLACLAAGREVVVSRGELVEIGGGFRIPEVLAQSGATLVEVGTTNRTHVADYQRAIGDATAILLKVHRSNFEIVGFASEVSLADLAGVAKERALPLVYDAGSGALLDLGVGEDTVKSAIRSGADVVTFSGDKLLGGPQAGVVVGRREIVAKLRRHPLMRALRPDKLCLAALHATLLLWTTHPERIPVMRMIGVKRAELCARADRLARALGDRVSPIDVTSRVGGGAAPSVELSSRALRVASRDAEELASALRAGSTPVVARIEDGAVVIDLRTIDPADDALLEQAIRGALGRTDARAPETDP